MKEVKSSNIHAIGWADGTLTVHFKNGTAYSYTGVPADVHAKLMAAESVGKAFGETIKGRYDFKKGDNWS